MNKKILILLVCATAIIALGTLIISANENVCNHNNVTFNSEYTMNPNSYCKIDRYNCPDCGYEDFVLSEHINIDGCCLSCSCDLSDVCEHDFNNGVCEKCDMVCDHIYKNGVCLYCENCLHIFNKEGICSTCGASCVHSYLGSVCEICGSECSHNWRVVDIEYTYDIFGDCYIESCVCDICGIEWVSGYEHTTNSYGVCIECLMYVDHVCAWENVTNVPICAICGKECDHPQWLKGQCVVCGFNHIRHSKQHEQSIFNPEPDINDYCYIEYWDCECEYVYSKHIAHFIENGKCINCGVTTNSVDCEHTFSYGPEGDYTRDQNSYCRKHDRTCADCGLEMTQYLMHEYVNGSCTHCGIRFVSEWYEEEIEKAETSGYNKGYAEGYNEGIVIGMTDGEERGYNTGKTHGYKEGYEIALEEGLSSGYEQGVKEGYAEGKTDGYREGIQAASDGEMGNLFYELFNAEVNVFQKMLNFEIFGINIATFLMSILSILVIAWIIKKVI